MEFLRTFLIAAVLIGFIAALTIVWIMAVYALKDMHPFWSLGLFFGVPVLGAAFTIAAIKHG